jgi:hypothetical protein
MGYPFFVGKPRGADVVGVEVEGDTTYPDTNNRPI